MRWISIEARHASLDSQLPVQWKEPFVYTERKRERERERERERASESEKRTRCFLKRERSNLLYQLTFLLTILGLRILLFFFGKLLLPTDVIGKFPSMLVSLFRSIDFYSSVCDSIRDRIIFSFAKSGFSRFFSQN